MVCGLFELDVIIPASQIAYLIMQSYRCICSTKSSSAVRLFHGRHLPTAVSMLSAVAENQHFGGVRPQLDVLHHRR